MVLEGSPGVHGDRAELDLGVVAFSPDVLIRQREIFCIHANEQMKAPVAVGLGVADIIFLLNDLNIIKTRDVIAHHIDIIQECTDNTDADGIMEHLQSGLRCLREILSAALFAHALVALDAAETVFDRIAVLLFFEELSAQRINAVQQDLQDFLQICALTAIYVFLGHIFSCSISSLCVFYIFYRCSLYVIRQIFCAAADNYRITAPEPVSGNLSE